MRSLATALGEMLAVTGEGPVPAQVPAEDRRGRDRIPATAGGSHCSVMNMNRRSPRPPPSSPETGAPRTPAQDSPHCHFETRSQTGTEIPAFSREDLNFLELLLPGARHLLFIPK